MMPDTQRNDRRQLLIFAGACILLVIVGFLWAVYGDAAEVTPIPTATPADVLATPTAP